MGLTEKAFAAIGKGATEAAREAVHAVRNAWRRSIERVARWRVERALRGERLPDGWKPPASGRLR